MFIAINDYIKRKISNKQPNGNSKNYKKRKNLRPKLLEGRKYQRLEQKYMK